MSCSLSCACWYPTHVRARITLKIEPTRRSSEHVTSTRTNLRSKSIQTPEYARRVTQHTHTQTHTHTHTHKPPRITKRSHSYTTALIDGQAWRIRAQERAKYNPQAPEATKSSPQDACPHPRVNDDNHDKIRGSNLDNDKHGLAADEDKNSHTALELSHQQRTIGGHDSDISTSNIRDSSSGTDHGMSTRPEQTACRLTSHEETARLTEHERKAHQESDAMQFDHGGLRSDATCEETRGRKGGESKGGESGPRDEQGAKSNDEAWDDEMSLPLCGFAYGLSRDVTSLSVCHDPTARRLCEDLASCLVMHVLVAYIHTNNQPR